MSGGIIAFHDYGKYRPEWVVTEYVNWWNHFARWPELGLVRRLKAFRRPG